MTVVPKQGSVFSGASIMQCDVKGAFFLLTTTELNKLKVQAGNFMLCIVIRP